MPAHAIASVLAVEDDPMRAEAEAEAARRHHLIMIESMMRDGYSEREIVLALEGED